ncbi:hypothetical protein HYR99_20135 [Candidatus Poribacteria bacterium]|nr:hypothetical protein [Candidatus Poribacteria bacterium]
MASKSDAAESKTVAAAVVGSSPTGAASPVDSTPAPVAKIAGAETKAPQPDLRLTEDRVLARDLRRTKALEFGKLIGLKGDSTTRFAEKDLNLEDANEATLNELVRENILNEKQKKDLKLTVDLSRLSGENIDLIRALKSDQLTSLEDFVRWEKSDWAKVIADNKVALPEGEESIESYAENLRDNIEKTFPTQYLLNRVIKGDFSAEVSLLSSVDATLKRNDATIKGATINADRLILTDIGGSDKSKIEKDLERVLTFANTYRHLGVVEIVNDKQMNVDQKKNLISQRLSQLDAFYKDNPNLDLYRTNFLAKGATLNWASIEESERPRVKKQMMAFQRTLTLAEDYEASGKLLGKGFDAAMEIASVSESEFLQTSGLDLEKGRKIYVKAQERTIATSHVWQAVRDAEHGLFKDIALSNQKPLVNDLREIDGYADLFGPQDYCHCEHCRSVLSPAAYFVDLMYFVQENISKKVFLPNLTDHPLYLKNRRPDLWKLKLTCQNTDTEIPYLDVVNDVLEQYVKNELHIGDVYHMLQQSNLSCALPFNLPLEELRLYLSHFELSLYDVYKLLKESDAKQHREKLKISEQELLIITTPNPAQAKVRFGNTALTNFDVQEFIRLAGISRKDLDDLLRIKFLPEIAQVTVKRVKSGDDIQQYTEVLKNLTDNRLDLIHRFVRLWKKTTWTIREFDLVLGGLKSASLLNSLEERDGSGNPKILHVAELIIIQQSLNLSAEEVCAMVGEIPLIPIKDNQKSLYQRLFDLDKIFGIGRASTTLPADRTQDKITPLLLAGLGITESELEALFALIQVDAAVDLPINRKLISDLFRHARIAKGLKLSIEDFINSIKLCLNGAAITQLSHIHTIIEFTSWLKSTPFTVSKLILILRGEESRSIKYQNDVKSAAAAVLEIQKSDESDKKALLNAYLQKTFNLTAEQLNTQFLPKLITTDINGAGITTALSASFTNDAPNNPADLDELVKLLREMERVKLLFSNLQFEAESITYFIEHKEVFGIANLKNLTLNDVKNAACYKSLVEIDKEMEGKVRETLKNYQSASHFSAADIKVLSDLWRQPQGQIQSLVAALTFAPTALEAIQFLWDVQRICQKVGVKGDSLVKLTAVDYAGLQMARNVVMGGFASKYDDEKNRQEKLEPYTDQINTLKRDALCDYIIARRDRFKFNDRADLYKFFLLDVEMSGCFRTSPIVSAISSVQLYINRCLINLEQSDKDLNPDVVDVKVNPTWIPADEWEWRKNYRVWEANRKVFLYPENYIDPTLRDNKTEIFKELEEELLQEKITKESAETSYKKYLAQFAELTKLRYAGAYYHSIPFDPSLSENKSVYYLFARTNVQPYQYYYRTYNHDKNVWDNWKKIELAIEANEISAVVHKGKLYIYWTEVQSKEISKVKDGASETKGVIFKVFVKYSFLNENNKWSSPQRLYVGYTHSAEDKIYHRVQGSYPSNEDERDRKHDHVFEQFERSVFRKPYALMNDDIRTPMKLCYIWSQNQGVQDVRYTTDHYHSWAPLTLFGITFKLWITVPSTVFVITNNQFNVSKSVIYHWRLGDNEGNLAGNLTLLNASSCVFSATIDWGITTLSINWAIPVNSQTLPIDISASSYDVSLSRNEIINDSMGLDIKAQNNNYKNINNALTFLRQEYDVAIFPETKDFVHYVEDGTSNFTNVRRILNQFASGDGLLYPGANVPVVMLTTVLTDELSDMLFAKGLEEFLSLQTQQLTDSYGRQFSFRGAYGEYYWEMFFHIPFLIANHLNANQKFKEAKWWYERIFNPTAEESPADTKPSDHNWQFREFRGLDIQKLKDILIDGAAIEAYKKDPFDPHAIAQLRWNAYQKSIVMKYIDNLIDWGDHLFAQDTRESIHEAEMLYQLASDILGKHPVKMGECETVDENAMTYEKIGPQIDTQTGKGSEFLIILENVYWITEKEYESTAKPIATSKTLAAILGNADKTKAPKSLTAIADAATTTKLSDMISKLVASGTIDTAAMTGMTNKAVAVGTTDNTAMAGMTNKAVAVGTANTAAMTGMTGKAVAAGTSDTTAMIGVAKGSNAPMDYQVRSYAENIKVKDQAIGGKAVWLDSDGRYKDQLKEKPSKRYPGLELVKQTAMAFCVLANTDLLQYWARVEDRLFKIRHCMNISGVRRSLALFQPPIDPMLLVRARAAGLSLEDITALLAAAAKTPNYRFTYLVEKAKQFTQTVQSFGSALLSALEKKDVEELTLLRSVHERNILRITTDIKKKQLQEAQYQYQAMEETLANVQNRIDYYKGLIGDGLTGWEVTQQISTHTATSLEVAAGIQKLVGGILFLIPQLGSPFAMKYGGSELGNSAQAIAEMLRSGAAIAHSIAASAGLEATFQRREQEWNQQLKLAEQEYTQVEKQVLAAEVRSLIAEKDLEVHEKNIEHANELDAFYKNKFTNLGLYNYLASTLNRLYREAYNVAYDMAKMAERAYQFEQDDSAFFIANDNWQFDRAGLLAGERLMLQLQKMEQAYIENNVRTPEITQSFSLALLDPSELVKLRQTGSCDIKIPEIAFEMVYPGQYKRLIKSVRLTIPCVVGPYTNVSAKLTLRKGEVEKADQAALEELLVGKNTSISTSSANNDAGMFEFNFRDERYLPFEGSGAISEWRLELPSKIRSFNYDTISDVILHISYTARDGNRETAENNLATAITSYAQNNGLFRLFSLKREFPNSFHRLLNPVAGATQTTEFSVEKSHFPYLFLDFETWSIAETKIYMKPKKGLSLTTPAALSINGTTAVTWNPSDDIAMPGITGDKDKIRGGTADLSGSTPIKTWTIHAGNDGLDKDLLDDILILIKYTVS